MGRVIGLGNDYSSDSDSDSSYYSGRQGRIHRLKNKMKVKMPDRDAMSETLWKWRCKIKGNNHEKTLADFESSETAAVHDGAATPTGGPKNLDLGTTASVKTMFEGPNSREGAYDWVEYPPKQLSKSAAKAQNRVAIKVYKIKDDEKPVYAGHYALRYHMIEVQNLLLVGELVSIMRDQNLHLDSNEAATFKYPFSQLYFGYDNIVARHGELKEDEPVKPFMLLMIKLLDDIFAEARAKVASLRSSGLTTFKLAWTLFPCAETVISWGNNCEMLSRVKDAEYTFINNTKVLAVTGRVLRFTGRAFQWEDYRHEIKVFEGNKKITDLPAYPLSFYEKDQEVVRERCIARGAKVLDYQGLAYVNYSGIALHLDADKDVCRVNVDGRVLIDVVGYNKHHLAKGSREGTDPQTASRVLVVGSGDGHSDSEDDDDDAIEYYKTPTTTHASSASRHAARTRHGTRGGHHPPPPPPPGFGSAGASKVKKSNKRLSARRQDRNKKAMLGPKHKELLMYMVPMIEGYALKNKLWVSFYLEDISPLVWNDAAYDHLVYDEQQKDLVMSFVENHQGSHISAVPPPSTSVTRRDRTSARRHHPKLMDVIAGKGEGLIMLLSGPPGTGKTLMAEAVADRTHRPLFYLQAEDLGTNAAVLGANVKKVFEMATEWDAVVLLDEADVFMAERHPQDILRNELVSIFLRELEYFRGIIFLTTNLYSTIDSAFRSRVSLHLLFTPLTVEARMIVWRKFLDRVEGTENKETEAEKRVSEVTITEETGEGSEAETREELAGEEGEGSHKSALTEEDLKELAAWSLNGREIKTAVKMVRSWCDYKGYEMTLSRLESGIRVTSPHAAKSSGGTDTSLYDE
ncbi:ATP-dependent zinc metalloprotease YME1L1 [Rhypophila decipiens]|uniref:ATP-dependent zinc metalloprotease YME1L1 n=1 Tax=Rhypophila decipiens TaxID=261697 RepID=A0AAN6YDG9_9PEZI|nr:ATP-dependent zinc metalloprotease YME1L1 [Rhypophila decipiens]